MSLSNPQPADFELAARADAAVRLFCEGASENEIAARLELNPSTLKRLLRNALRASAEEREEAVERHRSQLRYLWQRVVAGTVYVDDAGVRHERPLSDKTVNALLAIQKREASLLGLDAPTRAEHLHDFGNLSDEELTRQAVQLGIDVSALAALPAAAAAAEYTDGEIVADGVDS